jgi:hypothetical protein
MVLNSAKIVHRRRNTLIKTIFSLVRNLFLKRFLLVPDAKFFEVYDKREKNRTFFYTVKTAAKSSLVILSALVILTAPTV